MGATSSASPFGVDAAGKRQAWLSAAAYLALIFVAVGAKFWEAVAGAIRVWSGSETFNHGFLIVPIVAYLVWGRRAVFSAMSPRPTPWLLALLPGPVLAWMLQVVIAAVLGIAAYRALLFPCLYLFLLVRSGEWQTGLRFREDRRPPAQALRAPTSEQPLARSKLGAAAIALIAIAILGLGPAYAGYMRAQGGSEVDMTLQEPDARPPWRQVPWISSWRPAYVGATAQTSLAYSDTTATVELFMAVYADQGLGRELICFANRLEDGEVWRRVSDGVGSLTLDGSERPALLRRLDGRDGTRFVWRVYWVDGHWTASATAARFRYVFRKMMRGRSTSAVLVLSSSTRSEAAAGAAVRRFLGALSNISAMLR